MSWVIWMRTVKITHSHTKFSDQQSSVRAAQIIIIIFFSKYLSKPKTMFVCFLLYIVGRPLAAGQWLSVIPEDETLLFNVIVMRKFFTTGLFQVLFFT